MPRRKQQAPRRASAYVPDDLKEAALLDEDVDGEDSAIEEEPGVNYGCQDKDFLLKDSPVADFSSHEMDSESHLSESSDRMSDFESSSIKNEDDGLAKEPLTTMSSTSTMMMATAAAAVTLGAEEATVSGPNSLEQMKAIYNSFLTSSYWSSLNLNLTATQQQPPAAEKPVRSHSSSSSSSSSSSCGSNGYDWHQSAVAKTLQQVSQNQNRLIHPAAEPNLFSTVQLYRQSTKLYGSIFTGASKFRCKDCSAAYDTLVGLTVHMNETGHYRDDNHETDSEGTKRWSKPRKRSLLEMEGKEDAQKVLKCMYCGHSFESLQDLSVHMIKTKHYQKVPLKEPVTPVAAKIISSARKRAPIELDLPSSPDSNGGTPKPHVTDSNDLMQKGCNPYITPNNRYGHQNGASYAWQFESRKSQILKCMECGSSHDTLQELTAHMMVTGHFIKVTNSAIKKGKPIMDSPPTPVPNIVSSGEEKVQSVPLAATTFSPPPPPPPPPASISPVLAMEIKKEEKEEECTKETTSSSNSREKKNGEDEVDEKFDVNSKYSYLTEEDLEESPKGGFDILKSLENTVTSAINKAQNGAPSWGGYPSIHAAYQLPNMMKLSLGNSGKSSPLKYMFSGNDIMSTMKNQPLISPPCSQTSPLPKNNFHAMEELVKKVTEKVAKVEEKMREPAARVSPLRRTTPSPCSSEAGDSAKGDSPKERRGAKTPESTGAGANHKETNGEAHSKEPMENGTDHTGKSPVSSLCSSTAIITEHPPEQPFVNPLSALQSVMNVHLGKAAKPALPSLDPMSMLFKMSNSLAEKAAVAASTPAQTKKSNEHLDRYFYHVNNDQPIDLTKGKSDKSSSLGSAALSSTTSTPSSISPSSTVTMTKASSAVASFMSNSPLRENALSDISDMLRNLTEGHTSKSSTPTSLSERSDIEGATPDETEEISPIQKRKGRQSNWNPQHLLILQAQFASSLRQTGDGKFIMSDLSPQERMHISRFTGLSMTTISHWLANVKYQLRRTGGTKFLKNLDSGHPVFFCSDCASQIRSPSAYVSHLESHLGFRLRDLAKLTGEQFASHISHHTKGLSEKLLSAQAHALTQSLSNPLVHSPAQSPEDDSGGTTYQCKLCNRTFASKHAVKLHLSKTHGKSPEDHLLYVTELDKQ
ncbi:teashirt homolog 3b [Clupea harengus]|uniref:Teashirt homolog 3b n=1 Tax=Clupea harengus TaxID=7950 RepID=A0A6P8FPI1_CLUHA|nr:teashirt homolog 3b [Clupea harengus]